MNTGTETAPAIERQKLNADIVCVGFGPAMGGFLTTMNKQLLKEDGSPAFESKAMPGMPPQVICYERADDTSVGVSGVVTRAQAIRKSIREEDWKQIPMATPVTEERLLYLLDPYGASRRSPLMKWGDRMLKVLGKVLPWYKKDAFAFPWIPPFLHKGNGMIMSIGQFNQWVAGQVMGSGLVQIWPASPVEKAILQNGKVIGVQLTDQGVDLKGNPSDGFMPGMDVEAALTVVGDGPVGAVGRQLDELFGLPQGHEQNDWAVGMKMVVNLPEGSALKPGTVLHTFGYPEPEIFGFLYVHPDNVASFGIFVPSWMDNPMRSAYRYLQYWMKHPYLWQYLEGSTLRSWGAKTLQESGRRGEPYLVGEGYARIGEGSGSTNILTGSGVDEAWETGVMLAESVVELLKEGKDFSKANLEATYVKRRRENQLDKDSIAAEKSRDGFHRGIIAGLIGIALSGFTKGFFHIPGTYQKPWQRLPKVEDYFRGRLSTQQVERIRKECAAKGLYANDVLMEMCGWPKIEYDGKLLISHQDALLMGGKVQAPPGYANHVRFEDEAVCRECDSKICIEVCSGQAIYPGPNGVPAFDREKCVYCGACFWNCARPDKRKPNQTNLRFKAGAGGLHSAEN